MERFTVRVLGVLVVVLCTAWLCVLLLLCVSSAGSSRLGYTPEQIHITYAGSDNEGNYIHMHASRDKSIDAYINGWVDR